MPGYAKMPLAYSQAHIQHLLSGTGPPLEQSSSQMQKTGTQSRIKKNVAESVSSQYCAKCKPSAHAGRKCQCFQASQSPTITVALDEHHHAQAMAKSKTAGVPAECKHHMLCTLHHHYQPSLSHTHSVRITCRILHTPLFSQFTRMLLDSCSRMQLLPVITCHSRTLLWHSHASQLTSITCLHYALHTHCSRSSFNPSPPMAPNTAPIVLYTIIFMLS